MRRAIAGVAVVVVVLFVVRGLPWLTESRPAYDATPTIQPFSTQAAVAVPPGSVACVNGVTFGPDARSVFVQGGSGDRPSPPVLFEARAPGYRATAIHPGGLPDRSPISVALRPASHEVQGSLCLHNEGRRTITFLGVPPGRESTSATTTLDGKPIDVDLSVTLLESGSATTVSRLDAMFDHAAAFRPVTGWMLWILAIVAVLGVPAAIAYALGRAARADDA